MTTFYYRLLVLFLLLGCFVLLVAIVTIMPAYFVSSVKDSIVNTKLEIQKNEPPPTVGEQSLEAIKDMNTKLGIVENAEKNKFLLSSNVISAILLQKRSDIKITEISYQVDPIKGKTISVTGTAPSREVLLLFRQALENSSAFKSVDLPISNFVKGTDIQFNLNLIPS